MTTDRRRDQGDSVGNGKGVRVGAGAGDPGGVDGTGVSLPGVVVGDGVVVVGDGTVECSVGAGAGSFVCVVAGVVLFGVPRLGAGRTTM